MSPASIVRGGESFCIHDTVNRQMAWGTNQKRSFIASRLIRVRLEVQKKCVSVHPEWQGG